jgi:hypothetical protein
MKSDVAAGRRGGDNETGEESEMPLHDWKDERGWDGVHLLWLAQLLDWVQPRVPPGFRAYVGSLPALTLEGNKGRPTDSPSARLETIAPDRTAVARFTLDLQRALHVDWHGQLVAAVEIVSPRNKDRLDAKERYARRYVSYLRQNVHLMLIDVFARPAGFSFADEIASALGLDEPPTPAPHAVSYRVGGPVPIDEQMGTTLDVWRRSLVVGQPLPQLPLALDGEQAVTIDLDVTYGEAARRVYLE